MTTGTIRERLLSGARAPIEKQVEGIGQVFIRRMTLGEADEINKPQEGTVKHSTSMRLLARFIGDENGKPIFDLSKQEDVDALNSLPVMVAGKILEYGNAVNVPPKAEEKKD